MKLVEPLDIETLSDEERAFYEEALRLIKDGCSPEELSNNFFAQGRPFIARGKTPEERRAISQSQVGRWIQHKVRELWNARLRTKYDEVRLLIPKQLFTALKQEASKEGVSVNQWCVEKFAAALGGELSIDGKPSKLVRVALEYADSTAAFGND